jgi:hypothetical protein
LSAEGLFELTPQFVRALSVLQWRRLRDLRNS